MCQCQVQGLHGFAKFGLHSNSFQGCTPSWCKCVKDETLAFCADGENVCSSCQSWPKATSTTSQNLITQLHTKVQWNSRHRVHAVPPAARRSMSLGVPNGLVALTAVTCTVLPHIPHQLQLFCAFLPVRRARIRRNRKLRCRFFRSDPTQLST